MSAKKFLNSFITSPIAPPVLIGVISVVKLLNLIPTEYAVIAIVALIILMIIRWGLLEPRLSLIKEYKSLTYPLKNLASIERDTCIWQVVVNGLQNINLRRCWIYYFQEKGKDVDKMFNDLNFELDKLINNPYKLWNKNVLLTIKRKFNNHVRDNKNLYTRFIEMVDTEKISKNSFSYDKIKKAQDDFYSSLNQSRKNFSEIRDEFSNDFFDLPGLKQ